MSSRTRQGWGAYEFTRAADDEQKALEQKFSVWVEVSLHRCGQRGVYDVRVASVPMFDYDRHLKHSVTLPFPNGRAETFESLLYQLMYRLARMLEAAAEDAARQRTRLT